MKADDRYIDNIRKKVGLTLYKYNMLSSGDKVLVAISGEKDSMILLECLAKQLKHLPFPVELYAAHINITNIAYETDTVWMKEVCEKLNIPLHIVNEEIEIDEDKVKKKGYCFICSWNRRKMLFNLTKDLGCNKLAMGHHMDDALETLLMNMVYHASISSLPQKLKMFDGKIELIRPLLQLSEKELIKYAGIRKVSGKLKECPYGEVTKRSEMKDLLSVIETNYKYAKKNMFLSMDNMYEEYLPKKSTKH